MKRLLSLLLLSPLTTLAVTRTLSLSGPSQVYQGQSISVSASASTDASDAEQIGFFHGQYSVDGGATWTWYTGDTNVGKSATRNAWITAGGASSIIIVRAKIAFRGGGAGDVDYSGAPIDWGGSWGTETTPPTKYLYYNVLPPPNQAPTVTWVQNPASAWLNEWFQIQARGNDADGNLASLWVWREWVPHAFGGGGNGYEAYSDPNGASLASAGSITFQAQSQDASAAASPVIYHTVTVSNRAPTVSVQILNESLSPLAVNGSGRVPLIAGQQFHIRVSGTDPDGRLSKLYSRLNRPDGSAQAYPEADASGSSSAHNFGPYTATHTGIWNVGAQVTDLDGGSANTESPDVEVANTAPGPLTLTLAGSTVEWNATFGHYVMWTDNQLTVTSTLQDADGNLTGHTLRYQDVAGAGPIEADWDILGGSMPTGPGSSTKQASLYLTPGRWDFNAFGGDWIAQHPGASATLWVYGNTNNAEFVGQSVPTSATTGDAFTVSITMRNNGQKPWTTDGTPHRLGSKNPDDNLIWGVSRVDLAPGETVAPTAQKTFIFSAAAPAAPGIYNFQWSMLEAGFDWFGAVTSNVSISVVDNDAPGVPDGLAAGDVSTTGFTLSWNPSTDNAGVTLYEIERQGAGVVTSTTTSSVFSGLALNTTYQLRVRARDAAGNWSDWSDWAPVRTASDPAADNDGDGIPNGVETSLGTDPDAANAINDTSNTTQLKVHRP